VGFIEEHPRSVTLFYIHHLALAEHDPHPTPVNGFGDDQNFGIRVFPPGPDQMASKLGNVIVGKDTRSAAPLKRAASTRQAWDSLSRITTSPVLTEGRNGSHGRCIPTKQPRWGLLELRDGCIQFLVDCKRPTDQSRGWLQSRSDPRQPSRLLGVLGVWRVRGNRSRRNSTTSAPPSPIRTRGLLPAEQVGAGGPWIRSKTGLVRNDRSGNSSGTANNPTHFANGIFQFTYEREMIEWPISSSRPGERKWLERF
jgi:hypothetical protein